MPRTSPLILFGSNGIALRDDILSITVVQGGSQSFVDTNDLIAETKQKKYITFEPNMWLLDGLYHFAPTSNAYAGYISTEQSDENGEFSIDPILKFIFNSVYSTDGLTLYFSNTGDWSSSITVAFYNSSNGLIRTDTYSPNEESFSTNQAVADFKRIDITFHSTNNAYRFARLTKVDFDDIVRFTGDNVLNSNIIREINPVSIELPIDTLNFKLYSSESEFSILSPSGFYSNLQQKEPVDAYEIFSNRENLYVGRFYINEWNSETENKSTFKAIDEIGILSEIPISKDIVLAQDILDGLGVSIGELMEAIFDSLFDGSIKYEIATELYDIDSYGWVRTKQSYKDVLQELAFVGGAYITCANSNKIQVKMLELAYNKINVKVDERDASISWTGLWSEYNDGSAYLTTLKSMVSRPGPSEIQEYPAAYFTFEFTGVGFIIHYGYDFGALYEEDQYGKFYVQIDGGEHILIEHSGVGGGLVLTEWSSDTLVNGHHVINVYGWVNGAEDEGNSVIYFDAITMITSEIDNDHTITSAEKSIESPVELLPLVTGVEVVAHKYIWNGASTIVVYKADLVIGTYTIIFDEPHANYSITGATITAYGIDWVTFTVTSNGTVTINGREYVDSKTIYSVNNNNLPEGSRKNIIKITNVSFIHPDNAQEIANRIFEYYQQRYMQNTKLFANPLTVGDRVLIDSQSNKQINGIIEKQEIDLSGGFVSKTKIIGIVVPE